MPELQLKNKKPQPNISVEAFYFLKYLLLGLEAQATI